MTETHATPVGGHAVEPPERTSRQVWVLGVKILVIQVVTLILLWVIEAVYAGG
jgi:hypothetical protein